MNPAAEARREIERRARSAGRGGPMVETEDLSRDFRVGENVVRALHDVNLRVDRGER